MTERRLPHSLEAEQSLLGAILVDCEAASGAFQILSADDFYSPRHAKIYAAIVAVYDRDSTVDEVMLQDELARRGEAEDVGGLEYFEELIQRLPAAANAEHYAHIIQEKAILRAILNSCTRTVEGVYASEDSARIQLDRAEQEIFEIGRRGAGGFVQVGKILEEQIAQLDDPSRDGAARTVLSGFVDLDEKTNGFHPSELVVVAGRPSMGKTSFCMNVVEHAAMAGKTVGVFTLEVSKDQLVQNLLCSFSRVDSQNVRKKSLSKGEWRDLIHGANQLRQSKIFVDDTPGLTPLGLKGRARRLDRRHRLDLVVVDYLQLMEGPSSESRQQEITAISRSLKQLARELEIPVLAISQLSRGVERRDDHRPRMSDLRESGAIEQDADVVLLLYRHEYYNENDEEAKGKAEVIIAKQRNGPTGTVQLAFLSSFMRFENLAVHAAGEY